MNETRPVGNDTGGGLNVDVLAQDEKQTLQKQTVEQIGNLDVAVEVLPPEAHKLNDFLETEVFDKYDIPRSDKLALVKKWHGDELDAQFLDPEYDITSKGAEYFEAELRQSYEVTSKKNESLSNESFLNQLKTLQQENNWSNAELISYALESGQIPESQVAKFNTYQQLLTPDIVSNDEDRAIIASTVNGMDLMSMPDPVRFVHAEIYDNESISEETKTEIEQKLKIPRIPKVETASDALDVLDTGRVDKNGERQEFTADHPASIDRYTHIYTERGGYGVMDMKLPDGRQYLIRFSRESGIDAIGDRMIAIRVMMATESLGLAQPIFQRGYKITQGGVIDIHYDDIVKAKHVAQSLLGDTAGYDGKILGEQEIHRLKHQYQAFRKEGDWATGDNDPARASRDLKELTIINDDGSINWEKFDRACRYVQDQSGQGVVPEFENLKAFLHNHLKII